MRLTTLKLRHLKPCECTSRMLNSLPDIQGFGERMFQFDVKIPTKLWQAILRRRKLVAYGNSNCATHLTLCQAFTENDIDIRTYEDESAIDILNDRSYVRHVLHRSVHVAPADTELFDRFDIRVLRSVVLFRSPSIININVILCGIGGSSTVEAIFDVSCFPELVTERPSGALVSYTINV